MGSADYARLINCLLNDGLAADGKRVFPPGYLEEIRAKEKESGWGYYRGWVVSTDNGEFSLWHNGSNTMNYSSVRLFPDRKSAVILLTNVGLDLVMITLLGEDSVFANFRQLEKYLSDVKPSS